MSYMAFHAEADKALAGKFWGTKLQDQQGNLRDSGVQEFVETLLQVLSSLGPIELHRPLEFINHTNGPAIKIFNDGAVDHMGIRLRDKAGNEAQFGIGLGNEGITANNFVPHPKYSTDPADNHNFYSVTGGNAGTDREHPRAVQAGNGLIGFGYMINNFTVPFWDWFQQPQPSNEKCQGERYYTWNLNRGDSVVLPTYVPQAELKLAKALEDVSEGAAGTFSFVEGDPGAEAVLSPDVQVEANSRFVDVATDDIVVLACIDGAWEVIAPSGGGGDSATFTLTLGKAQSGHARDETATYREVQQVSEGCSGSSDVSPERDITGVCNRFFGCIETGDICVILEPVGEGLLFGPLVVAAPEKKFFSLGTTGEAITQGGSGDVDISDTETVTASSPFCSVPEDTQVAIARDTSGGCGSWTIIAAGCP